MFCHTFLIPEIGIHTDDPDPSTTQNGIRAIVILHFYNCSGANPGLQVSGYIVVGPLAGDSRVYGWKREGVYGQLS
jgi:hypothetical protein